MSFWKYVLWKTWLDKFLRSPVSEDPWKNNMVNGPKNYLNLNDSAFTVFIDRCEENSVRKSLS